MPDKSDGRPRADGKPPYDRNELEALAAIETRATINTQDLPTILMYEIDPLLCPESPMQPDPDDDTVVEIYSDFPDLNDTGVTGTPTQATISSDQAPQVSTSVSTAKSTRKPKQGLMAPLALLTSVLAVVYLAWTQLCWATEGAEGSSSRVLRFFPSSWMVLTGAIMMPACWVGFLLVCSGFRADFVHELRPKLWAKRPPSRPPEEYDKRPFWIRWYQGPLERSQRRPVGKHKQQQRAFEQLLEREELCAKPSLSDRILRRKPTGRKRTLLLLGLKMAAAVVASQPNIDLVEVGKLRNDLRKYKRNGALLTAKVTPEDRARLRNVLEDIPMGLLGGTEGFCVVLDTGCTKAATGFEADFIPGTLRDLPEPTMMDGIAGGLVIRQIGRVRYEVLDDAGEVQVLEMEAYLIPELKCRLFSPQAYLRALVLEGDDPKEKAEFSTKWNRAVFTWPNDAKLTVRYDNNTYLPIIRVYKDALNTASALALKGCVTEETNQNLTFAQKLLLRFHFRLGHIAFAHVQWLGRQGILGSLGERMGAATLQAPKCAACLYGKQSRTSASSKHTKNDDPGALSRDKLEPGQLVYVDQYESRVEGRAFTTRGLSQSLKFKGGTLFCDAASHYVFVNHQVSLNAAETVESKLKFEREALQHGVSIDAFHTDNGVFKSQEFMKELTKSNQGISMCGVSAHHQNGTAENAIKIVVRNARTMMLHAALRWPGMAEQSLWPMALSHAAYLYNITPKSETGMSPQEIFARTKGDHHQLQHAHPWGCPVYVLKPKLKDGQKIPKWEPRSKRGQYMGASPMHASTVGLVRNLQTGTITPQFHCVYDDFFETVHADERAEPEEWPDLVRFHSFRSEYDDADFVPELADEWLEATELQDRQAEREAERLRVLGVQQQQPSTSNRTQTPRETVPPTDETSFEAPNVGPERELEPAPPPEPPPVATTTHPLRRSTQQRKKPDYFHNDPRYYLSIVDLCGQITKAFLSTIGPERDFRYIAALLTDVDNGGLDGLHPCMGQFPQAFKATKGKDPDAPSYDEAMSGPHKEYFLEACDREIQELTDHKTWDVLRKSDVPEGARILPSTWAFKIKRFPDGRLRKYKARFCVRGDLQVEGIDYFEKYSPVVSWSTVRMMLCLAASQDLATRQVDFSNAFAQAELDDEQIYVHAPRGFHGDGGEQVVLKLRKSLYGLVQAPLCWGNHLKDGLGKVGLRPSERDSCMYLGENVIALTYVDDCLFFGKSQKEIDKVIRNLELQGFGLTVESDVFAFLGVEIVPPNRDGKIELRQTHLIDKILKTCNMENCNTKATPCNKEPLGTNADGPPPIGRFDYAQVVGMLMYLSSNSRPDIQYAVHQCARFTHFPKRSHEDAILRICRYLKGTSTRGLCFAPDKDNMTLDCYADADFAGLYNIENVQDPVSVKSRTGFCLTLGGCPLLWVSKLQTEVALSTTEAEYIALSQAMRELLPMRELLQEVGTTLDLDFAKPAIVHSTVFEDNNGALTLATSPRITPRTKHIAVKYHHFKTSVGAEKGIAIKPIDTDQQKADIFTKGLAADKFAHLRKLLMGW